VFDRDAVERLHASFAKVCEDVAAKLVERDGEHAHVHLLLAYPPKVAVSALVNGLKAYRAAGCARTGRTWLHATATACCGRPAASPLLRRGACQRCAAYIEQQQSPN